MIAYWFILSLIVGIIGDQRKIGGMVAFFLSLLLSPLIGLIIVLFSESKSSIRKNELIQVTNHYNSYKASRLENPNVYTIPEINNNQRIVTLSDQLIPNSEIGKPIIFQKMKKSRKVKAGKVVCSIQVGGLLVNILMPEYGNAKQIHKKGDFLLIGDPIFVFENISR